MQSDSGKGVGSTHWCLPIEELKRYRQIDAQETAVTERFSRQQACHDRSYSSPRSHVRTEILSFDPSTGCAFLSRKITPCRYCLRWYRPCDPDMCRCTDITRHWQLVYFSIYSHTPPHNDSLRTIFQASHLAVVILFYVISNFERFFFFQISSLNYFLQRVDVIIGSIIFDVFKM